MGGFIRQRQAALSAFRTPNRTNSHWPSRSFKPQFRRRPPSPTPTSPPRTCLPHRGTQSWTLMSRGLMMVADRLGKFPRLLLLLRGDLALRRSLLLRGGLCLCLLHHAALLAKSSGGVASVPARIAGTSFRLLQHNKKNSVRIKETCTTSCQTRGPRATQCESSALSLRSPTNIDRLLLLSHVITKVPANC
jgi:hypothetical protein